MKKYLVIILCSWFIIVAISSVLELYNRRSLPDYRIPNIPKMISTFTQRQAIIDDQAYYIAAPGEYKATFNLSGKGTVKIQIVFDESKQLLAEKNFVVDNAEGVPCEMNFSTYANKENIWTRDIKFVVNQIDDEKVNIQNIKVNLISRDWNLVWKNFLLFLQNNFSDQNRWERS